MSDHLKRILFISSHAPPAIGGPQNMYNLIKDLPVSSYSILTSFYHIDNVSARKGTWLPGEYIFYDSPRATREQTKGGYEHSPVSQWRDRAAKLKIAIRQLPLARAVFGIPVVIGQINQIVREGQKATRDRSIEIMMGFSDYGPAMIGTYLLHRRTKVPYYLFLFDIYKGNNFFFPGGILAVLFEERIFREAQKIVVTNEGTQEFYRARYGDSIADKMVVIYNSVFPEPYLQNQTPPYNPKPPYTILFTGRIYWPQVRSIKNLLRAVEGINDLDIKVKIYAPHPPEYVRSLGIESPKMSLDMAPPTEMPRIQGAADILLLPLSWHTKSPGIINTATPGKLTDYLIAGRPMLIHAPASTHLVAYAKKYGFAMIVDKEDLGALRDGIRRLLLDISLAEKLIKNAKETFFRNHDANKNKKIFRNLFIAND
ncbi:hypothetical protein A2V68_00110 [candidate division Kazan bacterium RBG_13_50_9]|uniref:Glycosyltransferase subfamily 4-like N-terminal domain-containing protein n=1 Tax=candidate division Kazan bacterium RBG_13_50_9 TaxID=1798535 RepID=A0A1F4NRP7_UNCK3|nr:MAG: hypothetical protein A2V68_00110 [candidate division Kazan bacterium RBG_13_50_9]